jgi:hypothetical protein
VTPKEPNIVYALIKMSEFSRIFRRAPDDDAATEGIYFAELTKRLAPYGIEVLEVEIPNNPTAAIIACAAREGL